MGNVHIQSTKENKLAQKKSIHHSSSTVFMCVVNKELGIDTEISFVNHFLLKRGITDAIAKIEIRSLNGDLYRSFKLELNKPKTYTINLSEYVDKHFLGSTYIFFQSKENLAIPFCAVMFAIKTSESVCGVHTYGRRLEQNELKTQIDLKSTIESGWTLRDSRDIRSFSVLHGGQFELNLDIRIECTNNIGSIKTVSVKRIVKPFGTLILVTQELIKDLPEHLAGKKGHAKVFINGLSGIFPRMLCGNYKSKSGALFQDPSHADEMQFTHTNFDFGSISQPDSDGNYGYYNQPDLPNGYGIVYPIQTKRSISIGDEEYVSNSIHHIKVEPMHQLEVIANNNNLPSRFVCAAIGIWGENMIESECSTGTFIEDYLKVPCRWHWGLLKPGFSKGNCKISIILNKFNRDDDLSREISFKIYSQEGLLFKKELKISESQTIDVANLLETNIDDFNLWYIFSGDQLEDLNIFSTFYPYQKSGFTEHAF